MANETFDPTAMPTTPRHGIRYPAGNDLVRYASQQFKAMAESIDDNIDDLPAEITARVDEAATQATASAQAAKEAAAQAGTLADSNMAANINDTDSKTGAALDQWMNAGRRWHKAVIIGDSLSKGYYNNTEHAGQGIGDVICSNLGISDVQNVAVSGSGYTVGTTTFPKQWDNVTDKADVDLVLVIGGVNDNNVDCGPACTQLLNKIRQESPNATTYVFPIAGGLGLGLHDHYTALHSINNAALALTDTTNPRVVLMQGVHRWGQMIAESDADGYIHMKDAGYRKWASIATKLMLTGHNTFWPEYARDLTVTSISGDPIFDQIQRKRFAEANGVITLQIIAHTGRAIDAGFTVFPADKYLCSNIQTKYLAVNAVTNCYLSVSTEGLKVEMANLPKDKWVMIEASWAAGM